MADNIQSLIREIDGIRADDDHPERWDHVMDSLHRLDKEFDRLIFQAGRSIKEKSILSSLLTRTSIDLKKVSDDLKTRAEELSTMLATIPAFVFFKDTALNYVLVNKAFIELIGKQPEEIIGRKLGELMPGYENDEYLQTEKRVVELGEAIYNIEEEIHYQERTRWVSSNLAPIRNPENKIVGLIGISLDITERKNHEEELRIAKDAAEAGTLAKNEFIASVSHEFRTPMNGIIGLAEILRTTNLSSEQTDLLKGITTSAQNLLVLLNDVLDFSAIEAGKMQMDEQPFMLDRVMEDIALVMRMKAREKNLEFHMEVQKRVPNHLIGDAQRLRQILINLVTNAIKFTEKGQVEVVVSGSERGDQRCFLRFDVTDTGVGIPEKAMDSLFRVFSRVKQERTRLIAGTGLGLSICKKLVDIMGGDIGVESTEGKGSRFWFTVPFLLTGATKKTAEEGASASGVLFHGKKVLVAEDNQINQRVVGFHLKKMGFEIELVSDGQEALDKYEAGHFDLIILDIQMPRMDGYQAARAIRRRETEQAGRLPIIALTANAMKGDRELYLDAGMDGYVTKPFTYETLLETIQSVLPVQDSTD